MVNRVTISIGNMTHKGTTLSSSCVGDGTGQSCGEDSYHLSHQADMHLSSCTPSKHHRNTCVSVSMLCVLAVVVRVRAINDAGEGATSEAIAVPLVYRGESLEQ